MVKSKIFFIFLFIILLTSCGYKAPPQAPEKLTPEKIKSINITKYPDLTIIWITLPSKYIEGKDIKKVKLVVEKCNDKCKKCETIFNSWTKPGKVFVEDTKIDRSTCYKIAGKTERKKRIPEEKIYVEKYNKLPRPHISVDKITENEIKLEIQGCKNLEASIYRKVAGERYRFIPYYTIAPSKGEFTDTKVTKGMQYCYISRCVRRYNSEADFSAPSNELCLRPMDITPPPVPQNLSGVFHKGKVYLAWDPVKAEDLAGYVIYRFEYGTWIRLNAKPYPLPTFVDEHPPLSGPLKYAVSSVDKSGNESKKSKPVILRNR